MIDTIQACDLVIFGAKGDLAQRKLLPALYKLEEYKKIHPDTRIIASGRADWTRKEYIKIAKTAIKKFLTQEINENIWNKFSARLYFLNVDIFKELCFIELKKILNQTKSIIIYYCAVPPSVFSTIFKRLGQINLNLFPARIIIEKPLGVCLKTCKAINDQISKYFLESQIFRIDHYLGKESILNLISLRFANSLFFNSWNNKIIDHVQITISEQVGIENRWNYFDKMGQTKDMVQNHLLQILTIIAMDPPKNISSTSIQNEKIKILRALKTINSENINIKTVRGQYTEGNIQGKKVSSYLEEKGANVKSQTETFVCIKVDLKNDQWFGVPFYLRTGKRLAEKYSEIVIVFKKMPINLFKNNNYNLSQNKLIIRLDPNENIQIDFLKKISGLNEIYQLKNEKIQSNLFTKTNSKKIDAYERLLLAAMKGDQSCFVCREETEEAWKWIDPIIEAWKNSKENTLKLYAAGTWGPQNADDIIMKDGRYWHKFH
ncbi:glucose-6-phosphate dehydrogenase [Buchnera aphidicola (Aphis glycines)]|uniref:Glucose-6-phosphate 1-dehydrogenase n=1 Tax=Buchnera aphidicola (Aphis glycines) TaxID=1265350 RepID=A0A0M4HG50_9GAMM|nr:glucose-6-phosphate dehydrogenase [Buchnera aphidicola]ALD15269.1 glucose-6-phosphate dehydrogenase [Buchnera aphidicola (Aphis glycines)]